MISNDYPESFKHYYLRIAEYRALGVSIAKFYHNQLMRCPIHLSIGQEYWLPILRDCFKEGDRCFSSHRSHSMYMGLNGDIQGMIAELYGHPDGILSGIGGSMHLKDISVGLEQSNPIVGSSLGIAIGSAFASKKLNENSLSVSYFGDGACEEGILHESLNLANIYKLPILFICENNEYSCNTSIRRRQSSSNMTRFAKAHNIKARSFAFYDSYSQIANIMQQAFQIARKEPCFLEISSFRLYEHCGHRVDRETGDRSIKQFNSYEENDVFRKIISIYPEINFHYENKIKSFRRILKIYESQNSQLIK